MKVESATCMMRQNQAMFTEASKRASLNPKGILSAEDTLQVMKALNGSWSSMRALKTVFSHKGVPVKLASEAAVKKVVNNFTVHMNYTRLLLDLGKAANGQQTEALVSYGSIFEIVVRDADAIGAGKMGTYKARTFPCDVNVE